MRRLPTIALMAAALAAGPAAGAGDPAAGKAKAAACAACHGADGNSANPEWPKLAGQHARYIVKQLRDFKAGGARSNAVMAGMAAPLSDQDMEDLAAYFASQPPAIGTASPDKLSLGRKLYHGGNAEAGVPACMACHGPAGRGDPRGAIPALGGQHPPYAAAQLRAFRAGTRTNDANGMMRGVTHRMTDPEIEAVADYAAGLQPRR